MKRITFYLIVALLTFLIGCFADLYITVKLDEWARPEENTCRF